MGNKKETATAYETFIVLVLMGSLGIAILDTVAVIWELIEGDLFVKILLTCIIFFIMGIMLLKFETYKSEKEEDEDE